MVADCRNAEVVIMKTGLRMIDKISNHGVRV